MNNFRINIFPDLFVKNGSADGMSSFTPKWDQESKISRDKNKVGLITEQTRVIEDISSLIDAKDQMTAFHNPIVLESTIPIQVLYN